MSLLCKTSTLAGTVLHAAECWCHIFSFLPRLTSGGLYIGNICQVGMFGIDAAQSVCLVIR